MALGFSHETEIRLIAFMRKGHQRVLRTTNTLHARLCKRIVKYAGASFPEQCGYSTKRLLYFRSTRSLEKATDSANLQLLRFLCRQLALRAAAFFQKHASCRVSVCFDLRSRASGHLHVLQELSRRNVKKAVCMLDEACAFFARQSHGFFNAC